MVVNAGSVPFGVGGPVPAPAALPGAAYGPIGGGIYDVMFVA